MKIAILLIILLSLPLVSAWSEGDTCISKYECIDYDNAMAAQQKQQATQAEVHNIIKWSAIVLGLYVLNIYIKKRKK